MRRQPEHLTLNRRPIQPGNPWWSAEWSRVHCWKRRTGQMPGGETAWSVRMQPSTECCFRADTPVCVTAACHTFSTAPCAEPSLWSLLPWRRLQYGLQTKPGQAIRLGKTLTPKNVFERICCRSSSLLMCVHYLLILLQCIHLFPCGPTSLLWKETSPLIFFTNISFSMVLKYSFALALTLLSVWNR